MSLTGKTGPAWTDGEKPGNGSGRVFYMPLHRTTDNREQTCRQEMTDTDNYGYSYSQVTSTTRLVLWFLLASVSGGVTLTVCFCVVLWLLR